MAGARRLVCRRRAEVPPSLWSESMISSIAIALLVVANGFRSCTMEQGQQDAAAFIAVQRAALTKLSFMDGVWRGPASTVLPSGEKHEISQTERIGPFLDGSVKVLEGRGYDASGKVSFNALGIISYDTEKKTYTLHSHAMGRVRDFERKLNAEGW